MFAYATHCLVFPWALSWIYANYFFYIYIPIIFSTAYCHLPLYDYLKSSTKYIWKQFKRTELDSSKNLLLRHIHYTFKQIWQKGKCFPNSTHIYFSSLEKRNRRSLSFDLIDIYRNLATVSGGHVFQTTQKQVPNAATIFKVCYYLALLK